MKQSNKYNYYKIIQGNYGSGWEDVDCHETNSAYCFPNQAARELLRHNLREYRASGHGVYRVIRRRELNK